LLLLLLLLLLWLLLLLLQLLQWRRSRLLLFLPRCGLGLPVRLLL